MFHQLKQGHSFTINEIPEPKRSNGKTNNDNVLLSSSPSPRAIVVLLGWMGADTKYLQKYADRLYHSRNCATIMVVANPYSVFWKNDHQLEQCAHRLVIHTTSVLRMLDNTHTHDDDDDDHFKIPIILHAFSNGGCYLVQALENMILSNENNNNNNASGGYSDPDILLFGAHLKGQVFDSAPCFVTLEKKLMAWQQTTKNLGKPQKNPMTYAYVVLVFVFLLVMDWARQQISRIFILFRNNNNNNPQQQAVSNRYIQFWNHMRRCQSSSSSSDEQLQLCCRFSSLNQAFIYSASDDITLVKPLEALIECRKQQQQQQQEKQQQRPQKKKGSFDPSSSNSIILVHKFDDSPHVSHYKHHPREYEQVIDTFLNQTCSAATN
mmetsp:Transcript_3911/g.5134  ORF Transcript_3911/g.5134 Transcript_3911/m.5134 type:complete len:379 (+) Transcript_3911:139-1275(+)|eukprot:CAMPEP_0198150694 /NCGR_PEP_ID=MMETSP1443-20131203/51996_1 /TAXON_ID=186043 /ORGANISM="Entomoneis sp., Strain CCMP2396" /LENGTH=378 /DNA_ID=CAMNT_0043816081 /DNA_START=64 /DNA_END=1200 /DNA_ORIENTATION=-